MTKKEKPVSMQALEDFFTQAGLTSKTPVRLMPGERVTIEFDESGNEFIDRKIVAPRKRIQAISDADLLKQILYCLGQDHFFDERSGKIVVMKISTYLKNLDGVYKGTDTEKNYRRRINKILPEIPGVIQYNAQFYYKKSRFFNLHSK